jgi:hypothetical protein
MSLLPQPYAQLIPPPVVLVMLVRLVLMLERVLQWRVVCRVQKTWVVKRMLLQRGWRPTTVLVRRL